MSIWNSLAKAAAATGGSVLGRTSLGSRIFSDRGADHPSYSGFTPSEHAGAADAHAARATQLMAASRRNGGSLTLRREAMQHQHFAATHRQAMPERLAASQTYSATLSKSWGTSSTARGMPIHHVNEGVNQKIVAAAAHDPVGVGAQHAIASRPHYNSQDHLQTAEHHATMANMTTSHEERFAHHILSQAHSSAAIALNRNPKLATKISQPNRLSPSI